MRDVLDRLFELQRVYLDHVRQSLGADCAHPRQGPILCLLLKAEGVSQADLTRSLGVSAATVAISIGRLERLGYVRRQRNPHNNRAYLLSLTAEGRMQAERLRMAMRSAGETAALGISDAELAQFCTLMARLTDNLRGLDEAREA